MGIPEAREKLLELAEDVHKLSWYTEEAVRDLAPALAQQIKDIVSEEMHRRPAVRRAPKRQAKPNGRQIMHVKSLASLYPDWPYTKIAQKTGLNIGRISEILNPPEK